VEASQYLALLGLWIAGIVAPGPDVLVILRNASLGSRAAGVLTAVGVMTGNLVWITLSLTGVTVLIGQADTLQRLIQVAGALFLGWLGVSGIRAGLAARAVPERVPSAAGGGPGRVRGEPQAPPGRSVTPGRAFVLGLVTNLSNAKAIIFFVALFANVTASVVTDPAEVQRLLVEQVTGRVRWRESAIAMHAAGVERFVEIGGKVVGPMIKRSAGEVDVVAAISMAEIEELIKVL